MYLAYSALQYSANNPALSVSTKPTSRKLKLRYRGYHAACKKYEQEIAAIQQYIPGWQPAFK